MPELIEPVQSGATLLNDIQATQPNDDQIAIWWLGQSGYAIKTAGITFYVDLYLSEHLTHKYAATEKPHIRMTRAPVRGDDLQEVRWVFASHKHSDHLDPATLPPLFETNPQAQLILPQALIAHAVSLGLNRERLIATSGDETLAIGAMRVHVLPSAHPGLDYDEQNGYLFLGFVFELAGKKIYHSGDTVVYDGLAERLKEYQVDIAFLPINGTDEHRKQLKVPPNMNIDEALELAAAIGKPLVIPHHYDMFTFNTVDVAQFIEKADAAQQAYKVLQCGEKFIWSS